MEEYICNDPNAPARLKGKIMTIEINIVTKQMIFKMDMPKDPTEEEMAYFKQMIVKVGKAIGVKNPESKISKLPNHNTN